MKLLLLHSDVISCCLATKRCGLGIDTEDVLSGDDFDNLDLMML